MTDQKTPPANFPAAVVIVLHMDPRHNSLMADILSSYTLMNVKQAEEGDILSPSTVYTANQIDISG